MSLETTAFPRTVIVHYKYYYNEENFSSHFLQARKQIAVGEDPDMNQALSCSCFQRLPGTGAPIPNEWLDFEQI